MITHVVHEHYERYYKENIWATFEYNAFYLQPAFQAVKAIFSKYLSERIRSFIHLTIQNMRHAQTLVRECFAFSAHPVPLNLIFVNFQMESSYVLTSTSRMRIDSFLISFVLCGCFSRVFSLILVNLVIHFGINNAL